MNLPMEIIENVCSYLRNDDLRNMKLVCRQFYDCIDGYIKREKIYDVILQRCYVCTRVSVIPLPMLCTFWKKEGEHREIDICSRKCRKEFIEKLPMKCFCMILCLRDQEEPEEQSLS